MHKHLLFVLTALAYGPSLALAQSEFASSELDAPPADLDSSDPGSLTAEDHEPPAESNHASSVAGRLRIGLGSVLAMNESATYYAPDYDFENHHEASALGITQGSGFGPLVAYGIGEQLMLTGRFVLARGETLSVDEVRVLVIPTLDYLWSPSKSLRPFVGAGLGMFHSNSKHDDVHTIITHGLLVGQIGLHAFMNEGVSFDAGLMAGLSAGLGTTQSYDKDHDITSTGYLFMLSVGLSYWTEGSAPSPRP